MSQQLINLSPDLKRLEEEGYSIEMRSGYLLLKNVPYVTPNKEVKRGILVSDVTRAGERTAPPADHVVRFVGEHPCHHDGTPMTKLVNESVERRLDEGLVVNHSFSSKPTPTYPDYYEKMTTYVAILLSQAQVIEPDVTAKTFQVMESDESNSMFQYADSASTKAEIVMATNKLKLSKIAIVGVGGTGSYILDLIAKTPVKEIHLFDGDVFLQHNAFRAPGAPSREELMASPKKVKYFEDRYSKMHRGIIAHGYHLKESNLSELEGMDFVFLSLDGGASKKGLIQKLEELDIPFVDTGIGLQLADDTLFGSVRLTTSTQRKRDHVSTTIGFSEHNGNNQYDQNIQVADLNALNASLAVIRWKKLFGFYKDYEEEHNCVYDLDGNFIHNTHTK